MNPIRWLYVRQIDNTIAVSIGRIGHTRRYSITGAKYQTLTNATVKAARDRPTAEFYPSYDYPGYYLEFQ